ncbi:hypothetical protein NEOLEDRAFT_13131 [Neolentinus lepideus HHB14362 ss-1]|uniref:FMR1-interacting protein 1 conserved domain-containing protein n=1 Tax=Neolentinus lepideus HHB14362 ss-1 TaxID=1314782 RepID=A0A165W0T5_9AGAM|nr:hypothetical protein NEOLEDRAFT_13131 [Neolentinus lepideus HHB14362 ss-1]
MPPPGHSSLPQRPHQPQHAFHGTQAANAVAAALQNPYSQYYYQSPQYSQAYLNAVGATLSGTTPQGYTLSSTYVAGPSNHPSGPTLRSAQDSQLRPSRPPSTGSWYQPGNERCTYRDCQFTGSKKSVEIHMMDRHLIYPPGWQKRKKQSDWDADPSLKGKPIPIQGTNLILDTPEALDAWIAERRKRWPSAARVEDRKRKIDEAIIRGQLDPDISLDGRKKRRMDDGYRGGRGRGRGRGRSRGAGDNWGRGRGVVPPAAEDNSTARPTPTTVLPPKPQFSDSIHSSKSESDSDDAPEAISSKPPIGLVNAYASSSEETIDPVSNPTESQDGTQPDAAAPQEVPSTREPLAVAALPVKKPFVLQPKRPPHNPFGSRPSLLRRLLLPEIRMTVSNFSQAIHFLVDNDFLETVELRPGEASEKMIEVIGETDAAHNSHDAENAAELTSALRESIDL